MADTTILNGDVGVTWFDNNRQKRLEWIGGTNNFYTMNQLYSAMQTLQDETDTIDDGTAFFADTPTEYKIGKIDQGDPDPWYTTFELLEHLQGGSLYTTGWARVEGTNTGIICVQVDSGGTIVKADEGLDITHSDGDAGTLLEFIDTGGAVDYCIIRPDSNASGDSFDAATSDTLTCNGHTADVLETDGVATTGEMVWANIYTIGTVEDDVHMYIYQGTALTTDSRDRLYSWNDNTVDWWGNGHIDVCAALRDITAATWATVDDGYLRVYARKGGDLRASFEVANSTTSGGRNPVPLQTEVDSAQEHGTQKISFSGAVSGGPFTDGEIIVDQTTGGRGRLDLGNSTVTSGGELVYFPIADDAVGGTITAMGSGNTVQGDTSNASVTTDGSPADDGPADAAWFSGSGEPTLSFTATTADIDNDTTDEYYGIVIDCNQNRLSEVIQWAQYIVGYGQGAGGVVETAETGVNGEEYNGATASFTYTGGTTPANIVEGESVTQPATGATGVVLSHDSTNMVVLLRSARGTFNNTTIDADDDSSTFTGVTASNFAAKTASPFGTFSGGNFFGARGVLVIDYHADDTNAFTLTSVNGGTYTRPTSLTFTVTNLQGSSALTSDEDDKVSWFQLTGSGGGIDKDMFSGVAGTPSAGDATFDVASTIEYVPDAGTVVIVQNPGSATAIEYPIRYTSWTGTTFTLANFAAFTATATTTATQVTYATGGFNAAVKRGDLVYNSSVGAVGYVATVDSDTQLTLQGAGIPGQTDTDTIEINCVPANLDTGDDVYVPYIHKIAESASEATSFIDPTTQIFYRVTVRNTRNTTTKIKPFSTTGNTTSANASVQVTRTEDGIIT